MRSVKLYVAALCILMLATTTSVYAKATSVYAKENATDCPNQPAAREQSNDAAREQSNDNEQVPPGTRDFAGLSFGVALSLTADLGGKERIESAIVVDRMVSASDENGVVVVEDENQAIARIMLESHFFFTPGIDFPLWGSAICKDTWGWGPFVGLQPGTDEIIEAIALGLMIGFKRPEPRLSESWNLGLGLVVDPNVNTLGDGIVANEPLPPEETNVRYKEESQLGIVLLTSFSW